MITDQCVWLGVDVDLNGQTGFRMHLTQDMVKDLLPILRHFVRTGALGHEDLKEKFQVGTWVHGVSTENRDIEGRVIVVVPGQSMVVQNNRVSGEEGRISCDWERADLIWEVSPMPEYIPTRYERLMEDGDGPDIF